jgi:hypothetical protein
MLKRGANARVKMVAAILAGKGAAARNPVELGTDHAALRAYDLSAHFPIEDSE